MDIPDATRSKITSTGQRMCRTQGLPCSAVSGLAFCLYVPRSESTYAKGLKERPKSACESPQRAAAAGAGPAQGPWGTGLALRPGQTRK